MLDRSLVGFRSILVEWQLKTNVGCDSIWVSPLYTSLLIRGQSAAIRGLDRGGAEGNPRGAAGAGGNPRNPPALQIREARMNRLVSQFKSQQFAPFLCLLCCWPKPAANIRPTPTRVRSVWGMPYPCSRQPSCLYTSTTK